MASSIQTEDPEHIIIAMFWALIGFVVGLPVGIAVGYGVAVFLP